MSVRPSFSIVQADVATVNNIHNDRQNDRHAKHPCDGFHQGKLLAIRLWSLAHDPAFPASLNAPIEPGTTTNGQPAELFRDLICHSIEFLMTLAVGLIEERLL